MVLDYEMQHFGAILLVILCYVIKGFNCINMLLGHSLLTIRFCAKISVMNLSKQ